MSGAGARYQQGVAATSAQGFQASIAGKEGKWMANFQNAFSS
jgi:membrane-bound inhibitor of C-type lysozyme